MNYDRAELSDEEQVSALATILAVGLTRWCQQQRRIGQTSPFSPDSSATGLEVSRDTVLSVTNPVNGPENQRPGARA
jgi:hypothetical protein